MVPHHLGFTFSRNLFCVLKQPSSHKCSRSCSLLWNGLYAFAMAGRWLARPTPITRKHTCFITHNPYKPSHRHSILIASCSTKDQVEKNYKGKDMPTHSMPKLTNIAMHPKPANFYPTMKTPFHILFLQSISLFSNEKEKEKYLKDIFQPPIEILSKT